MTHYPITKEKIIRKDDGVLNGFRSDAEKKELEMLHSRASYSKDHRRQHGSEEDHRLPYKRDVDRVLHSKAYSRYIDKTQVVYLVSNDHVTHRSLHVQLVSNFARGIAEILRLNGDLVEAIALGHDVGHPPFGHEGEVYLSELSEEFGGAIFAHPAQSCRLFREIEPLNLGLAVYDGFLCHDGGMKETTLSPRFGKTWDDHFLDLKGKFENPEENIIPATLEGCLVKICDTMSYIGKDIEDAISIGILEREDVPETILGNTNRQILNVLARDVIKHSFGKDVIAMSNEAFEALQRLRSFNFRHIYVHPKLKRESHKIKRSYRILFKLLLEDIKGVPEESHIWRDFLHNKTESYLANTTPVQKVVDYIAGMTDSFFIHTLESFVVPNKIKV